MQSGQFSFYLPEETDNMFNSSVVIKFNHLLFGHCGLFFSLLLVFISNKSTVIWNHSVKGEFAFMFY